MNTHALLDDLKKRSRFIEGHRYSSDIDVAAAFGVSVRYLRWTVSCNRSRFPDDALYRDRSNGCFFTEVGILLLSGILNSPQAVQTSIEIIRELFGFNRN
jgi:hypothetical protein